MVQEFLLSWASRGVLDNEAHLVDASFGRIKILGGAARTALDEPFVLKATNIFSRKRTLYLYLLQNGRYCTQTTPRCMETCVNSAPITRVEEKKVMQENARAGKSEGRENGRKKQGQAK